MDVAVALVQAYLQVNGYFTVCEYPVIERRRSKARAATLRTWISDNEDTVRAAQIKLPALDLLALLHKCERR